MCVGEMGQVSFFGGGPSRTIVLLSPGESISLLLVSLANDTGLGPECSGLSS